MVKGVFSSYFSFLFIDIHTYVVYKVKHPTPRLPRTPKIARTREQQQINLSSQIRERGHQFERTNVKIKIYPDRYAMIWMAKVMTRWRAAQCSLLCSRVFVFVCAII